MKILQILLTLFGIIDMVKNVESHLRFVDIITTTQSKSMNEVQSNANMTCTDVGYYSKCCDYNGIYLDNGNCKCDDGYETHPSNNLPQCNYKQKNRLTVFLLQLFIGEVSGAGFFYAGRVSLALGQILLFWIGLMYICCTYCAIAVCCSENESSAQCFLCTNTFLYVLWGFAVIAFWFVGWILPISENFKDGNGVPLTNW